MKKSRFLSAVCAGVLVLITTTTNAAVLPLEGRLPATPGGTDYQAYYDRNLNITWAADPSPNTHGDDLVAWAASLNIGGVTGWRLPSADVNDDGTVVNCQPGGVSGCEDNEMSYLYWEEGITSVAPNPFPNVYPTFYWSGTEHESTYVWCLDFANGILISCSKEFGFFIPWAVRSGDVSFLIDSDGDGLTDGDEAVLGTDPYDSDSDDDGILDGSDPDVLADVIASLPLDPNVFANRGDPEGQRNAILTILIDIQSDIASGDNDQAIRALQNLRRRVDGCGTSADRNDWITDCGVQVEIRRLIDLLITNLEGP